MLGAIFGDMAGSAYEFHNTHDYDFPLITKWTRPTDDTYMTLAVARALMETWEGQDPEYVRQAVIQNMREIGNRYPDAGFGGRFFRWLRAKNPRPYHSCGNGSAMRVSPAGWLSESLQQVRLLAKETAEVTHDHPEGIKGAQAVATGIYLARTGYDKRQIMDSLADFFNYNLDFTLDEIRPAYTFDVTCQGSVPQAIRAFYEGQNYEDVVRLAVSLGGDSDTIACMAGAMAEAYYGMPERFQLTALRLLDPPMRKIALDFQDFRRQRLGLMG